MPSTTPAIIIGGGISGLASAYWAREQSPRSRLILLERVASLLPWLDRYSGQPVPVGRPAMQGDVLENSYTGSLESIRQALEQWPGATNLDWLESLGVELQANESGTVFAKSPDQLRNILLRKLEGSEVEIRTEYALESISRQADGSFRIWSREGDPLQAHFLLFATGGERNHGLKLAGELGHEINLVRAGFIRLKLASAKLGSQIGPVEAMASVRCLKSGDRAVGRLSLSARGLEGEALSRLAARRGSAWEQLSWRLKLEVDWLPSFSSGQVSAELETRIREYGRREVVAEPLFGIGRRQWQFFLSRAKIQPGFSWNRLKRKSIQALIQQLKQFSLNTSGMGLPSGERAWAGGVSHSMVDWKSGASDRLGGVWFAGEILDFLGMPGGAHLNAIWATAYRAGSSMGREINRQQL